METSSKNGQHAIEISDDVRIPFVDENNAPNIVNTIITLYYPPDTPSSNQTITLSLEVTDGDATKVTVKHDGNILTFPCEAQTGADGTINLSTTATGAAVVNLIASYQIEIESDDDIEVEQDVTFEPAVVDRIDLTIDKTSAQMNETITATATALTVNGHPIPNVGITLLLTGNDAALKFNSAGASDTIVIMTDENGQVSAGFTQSVWGEGYILAFIKDPSEEELDKQKLEFTFTVDPRVVCTLNAVQVNRPRESNRIVCNAAPADNVTMIIVSGTIELNKEAIPGHPSVRMSIDRSETTAYFYNASGATPISAQCGSKRYTPGSTPDDKTFEVALLSASETPCTVQITLSDSTNMPVGTVTFSFNKPWANVGNPDIAFFNRAPNFQIYANGCHQATVIVQFHLLTYDGDPLPDESIPSLDDVFNCVSLTDFTNGSPLPYIARASDPPTANWVYGRTAGGYNPSSVGSPPSLEIQRDNYASEVTDNGATLYLYIRSKNPNSTPSLTIGMTITPNGCAFFQKIPNDDSTWECNPVTPIVYAKQQQQLPHSLTVSALDIPKLTQESFSCVGTATNPGNQTENGRAYTGSYGDYAVNFYRQIDYTISITPDFMAQNHLNSIDFEAVNPDVVSPSFCYSSRTQLLYSYCLYVWPSNIDNLGGISHNQPQYGSYWITDGSDYGAHWPLNQSGSGINVTRYIAFAPPDGTLETRQSDVNIVATDDYGTEYEFYLMADPNIPKYDLSALSSAALIRIGPSPTPSFVTASQPQTYSYAIGSKMTWLGTLVLPALMSNASAPTDADKGSFGSMLYKYVQLNNTVTRWSGKTLTSSKTDPSKGSNDDLHTSTYTLSLADNAPCFYEVVYDRAYTTNWLTAAASSMAWPATPPAGGSTMTPGVSLYPVWSQLGVLIGVNTLDATGNTIGAGYAGVSPNNNVVYIDIPLDSGKNYFWTVGPKTPA